MVIEILNVSPSNGKSFLNKSSILSLAIVTFSAITWQVVAEKKPEKNNEWFCVYNIKIGDTKFKKGTKIDKVDNELDARKQLDIYIKRSFSKIRSITKVVKNF